MFILIMDLIEYLLTQLIKINIGSNFLDNTMVILNTDSKHSIPFSLLVQYINQPSS